MTYVITVNLKQWHPNSLPWGPESGNVCWSIKDLRKIMNNYESYLFEKHFYFTPGNTCCQIEFMAGQAFGSPDVQEYASMLGNTLNCHLAGSWMRRLNPLTCFYTSYDATDLLSITAGSRGKHTASQILSKGEMNE